MDEPTSVLTPQEADDLFVTLRRLASEGLLHPLHQPPPRGSAGDLPSRHHPPPRQGRRRMRPAAGDRAAPRQPHGRRRGPGTDRARARAFSAPVRLAVHQPVDAEAASLRRRARRHLARSARRRDRRRSPGLPATVRTSSSTRSPAKRRANRADAIRIDDVAVRPAAASTPAGGLNAAFVPEERLGHGAVPRFRLSQNVVLTRHATGDGLVRSGVVNLGGARDIANRVGNSSTCARAGPTPRPARSPAATCRNSSSAASSTGNPACSSSASRPGGSMPAPRPPSARR